jgi:hypothetical protein
VVTPNVKTIIKLMGIGNYLHGYPQVLSNSSAEYNHHTSNPCHQHYGDVQHKSPSRIEEPSEDYEVEILRLDHGNYLSIVKFLYSTLS